VPSGPVDFYLKIRGKSVDFALHLYSEPFNHGEVSDDRSQENYTPTPERRTRALGVLRLFSGLDIEADQCADPGFSDIEVSGSQKKTSPINLTFFYI